MKRTFPNVVDFLGIASSVSLCGCLFENNCDLYVLCPEPEPPPACVADPEAGPATEACGVFVSASLGDDAGPGTRTQPVRTMKQAIALALAGPRRVYACAETFAEPVVVPSGVEIWGGLGCANGWVHLAGAGKTTLAPGPDALPLQFMPGDGKAIVADVPAEAMVSPQSSGSSIAAIVMPYAVVEILRSELVAGDGAPGMPGRHGGDQLATTGTPGLAGGDACQAVLTPGAPSVVTQCNGLVSTGGQGGEGTVNGGGNGLDGEPAPAPNPAGFGDGGLGDSNGPVCLDGQSGADGAHGEDGLGATGPGRITAAGWEGQNGKDGVRGLPGQGGGGGGGSHGGSMVCFQNPQNPGGASGGSGGGGGCGGRAGGGGGYGGASIALLSLSADVTVRDTAMVTGRGGDGGAGGLGQLGGIGGIPGPGGAPPPPSGGSPGCNGGAGGQGGNGGHGGGGLGGPSIGVAHMFGQAPALERVTIQIGSPGKGGAGASPDNAGADGLSGDVVSFPLAEGKQLPSSGIDSGL